MGGAGPPGQAQGRVGTLGSAPTNRRPLVRVEPQLGPGSGPHPPIPCLSRPDPVRGPNNFLGLVNLTQSPDSALPGPACRRGPGASGPAEVLGHCPTDRRAPPIRGSSVDGGRGEQIQLRYRALPAPEPNPLTCGWSRGRHAGLRYQALPLSSTCGWSRGEQGHCATERPF